MMYPYMTLDDGTEIVHSELISKDGTEHVIVHFERPTEDGFDDARCELPSYTWTDVHGFSKEELALFDEMVRANAHHLICCAPTKQRRFSLQLSRPLKKGRAKGAG